MLVVGATNRPQELDDAARRRCAPPCSPLTSPDSPRLAKRLYIPLPEAEARRRIISNLLAREKHSLTEHQV